MRFTPEGDAQELRHVVREFLLKRSSEHEVRRLMEQEVRGFDIETWTEAAQQLGLQGLTIPEKYGGSSATPQELGVVFEEMGAALYCAPFLSSVGLGATALMVINDAAACADYLPGIAAGTTIATLAWSGSEIACSTVHAVNDAGTWLVTGDASIVVGGHVADLVLVAAQTSSGTSLLAVQAGAPGLNSVRLPAMDLTRPLTRMRFDRTPARLIGIEGAASPALRRTADIAGLYLASEQIGGADRVLSTTVEYAKLRVQFGRPIGSFQAIKHRCADMLVDVESAKSGVWYALWAASRGRTDLPAAADTARSLASEAFLRVAGESIQIHGGTGFTWEHSAHLFFKRAKSSQQLLGNPVQQRSRLAATLLEGDLPAAELDEVDDKGGAAAHPAVAEFLHKHPVPDPGNTQADCAFREARFDAGLALVHFDEGFGGQGQDPTMQSIIEECFAAAGAADHTARNVIGLGMALPTIHTHGTEEQKRRFLRPAFSGEHIWCQLFSEPGAGSDLAGLSTRAVLDGDDFIVNGQKVWTSLGHVARWGLLLARTDPDVPKHAGLTYFVVDMKSAGIDVRPLRQLTGESEFNEVHLTNVRVPGANVLGEVGAGWSVALTTLANERESLGSRPATRGSGPIGQATECFRSAAADGRLDAILTDRFAALWSRAEAARLTNLRAAESRRSPGPAGSIAKLQMAELNKAIYELCVDLSGPAGLLIDDYDNVAPDFAAVHGGSDVRKAYLRSLANSIEGGTSEIQRNILGERVLGLPPEPRLDRGPWKEVRRS